MTNHKLKVVSKDSDLTDMSDVWDTKNRLLAASYNGYVSSYIYDGEGQRTVKMSAPHEAVYTNSADATVPSDTLRYTLYVGPHYTVTSKSGNEDEDPLYVKHFFGNKRIASKIGNPPGNDPRGITGVAGKTLHIKVDYPVKYGEQKAQVSGNYTNFAMPYSNIDMNNYDYPFNRPGYWNGCVPPNNTGTVVIRGNRDSESEETDSIGEPEQRTSPVENLAFYYHTDHLGSTNLVTDRGRSICHATEYLPYGEVFVDLQTSGSDPDLPFKFNGKEMDPETGMLYYGARYYMPKYYQWPTCDPLELKYPGVSSYSFCHNNPLNRIDLLGLYDTEAEAAKAASSYHAQYYQDRQSGKWFVALNEYGNGAYMSGGTMTRDFGTKDNLDIKGFYNTNFAPYSHIDFRYYNHLLQNVSSNTSTGFTVMSNVAKRTQPVLKMFGISKHLSDSHLKAFKLMNGLGNVAGGIGVVTSLIEGYHSSDIKKAECYSDALFGTIGLSGYGVPISLIYSLGGKDLSRKQVSIQMKTGIIGLPSTMPTKY